MDQMHGTIPNAKAARVQTSRLGPRLAPSPNEPEDEQDEESTPGFLQYCWPAIFGIMLAVITQTIWNKVDIDWGEVGLRIVYPFVLLSGRPEFGFGPELTKSLPQLMLYVQFPLEGLLVSFSLSRRMKFSLAMVQIGFLHFIGAFVLWLLSTPGASHGL